MAPRGWHCRSNIGADGTYEVAAYPRTAARPRGSHVRSPGDAVTLENGSACQGCIYGMVCSLLPSLPVVQANGGIYSCPAKPVREQAARLGRNVTYFYDPSGVAGQGDPSGGEDPAVGVLIATDYSNEAAAAQATCTLPKAESGVCEAIIAAALANQAAP